MAIWPRRKPAPPRPPSPRVTVAPSPDPAPGVHRAARLSGHSEPVCALAWSPTGRWLASADSESTLLWSVDGPDANRLRLHGSLPMRYPIGLHWHPSLPLLAGTSAGEAVVAEVDDPLRTLHTSTSAQYIRWSPDGRLLSANGFDRERRVVLELNGTALRIREDLGRLLPAPRSSMDGPLVWSPDGRFLATADRGGCSVHPLPPDGDWSGGLARPVLSQRFDRSIFAQVGWTPDGGALIVSTGYRLLVVDTRTWTVARETQLPPGNPVAAFQISPATGLIATVGLTHGLQVWTVDDLHVVAEFPIAVGRTWTGVAAHPTLPLLAVAGQEAGTVDIWELDVDLLLGRVGEAAPERYKTAKVVLVGEQGVGKTGLGYRLAHGEFKEHPSTHGQQFWVADQLGHVEPDGTRCEVVLWDLAGQPDYRLTHVLFLDDATAALLLFDAAKRNEALDAVQFWAKALTVGRQKPCPTVLVAGRSDTGTAVMTEDELVDFARATGISGGYHTTSAATGDGLAGLTATLEGQIDWSRVTTTVATPEFTAVRDWVLRRKQAAAGGPVVLGFDAVRDAVAADRDLVDLTEQHVETALRHLETHGYVRVLRNADGERSALLAPELLNNLAASFVLAARANPRGLGALDESLLGAGGYRLPELDVMDAPTRSLLVDATVVLFLEHNVCFRESLGDGALLVFPELINEKPPVLAAADDLSDDATILVSGATENVYASLVVLLGYTNVLVRRDQWQNQASYTMQGTRMGLRQARRPDGTLELDLSYEPGAPDGARRMFQGLVEQFLSRPGVTALLYPAVSCPQCGSVLDRSQVVRFVDKGTGRTFCPDNGHPVDLPTRAEVVGAPAAARDVFSQARLAGLRTELHVALTQLRGYLTERGHADRSRTCFVSYAWGDPEVEEWVGRSLARDLEQAGVAVTLDQRDGRTGASLGRFVSRIEHADRIVVVGTPRYREKYENKVSTTGSVVAAEVDVINLRLLGTEQEKDTVLPVLHNGTEREAFPPLVRARVHADFTDQARYFSTLFDLALDLWDVPRDAPEVADLRDALRRAEPRR